MPLSLWNILIWTFISFLTIFKHPQRLINRFFFYIGLCLILHQLTIHIGIINKDNKLALQLIALFYALVLQFCFLFARLPFTFINQLIILVSYILCLFSTINSYFLIFLPAFSSTLSFYLLLRRYKKSQNITEKAQILTLTCAIILFTLFFLLKKITLATFILSSIFLFSFFCLSFLGISITYLELLIGIIIGILVAIAFLFKAIFMLNTYLPVAITLILTALLYPYIRLLFLKKKIDFEELKEIIQSIQLSSILNIIKKKLQIKDAYFIFNPDEQLIKLFLSKRKPLTFLDIALSFNKETQINPQIEDKLYKLNMYAGVPLFTSNTHTSNNKLLGLLILGKRIGLRVYDDISLYYLAKLSQDLAYLIERKLFYFFKITNTLIKEIETRDKSLYEHCQGVAEYSDKIGKKLGLTKDMLEKLKISAYLHDIGKLGINQKILNKPAKLTKEEFEQVKKHTIIGYDLIKAEFEGEKIILEGVRYHHERLDGLGYPDGLKEKDIPLWVRILSVADAYQAMTSDRPYRKRMTQQEAISELKKSANLAYDDKIINTLISVLKEEKR